MTLKPQRYEPRTTQSRTPQGAITRPHQPALDYWFVPAGYQTGILKRLPDLPVPYIDSNRVNASNYAYKRAQTPDAVLMILTYGLTTWLAAAGGKNRAKTQPWLPIALSLKTLADTATNVQLATEEWQENKAFCAYCQTATLLSAVSVALAVPEAAKALRNVFNG